MLFTLSKLYRQTLPASRRTTTSAGLERRRRARWAESCVRRVAFVLAAKIGLIAEKCSVKMLAQNRTRLASKLAIERF